jgi:hypothetical protein
MRSAGPAEIGQRRRLDQELAAAAGLIGRHISRQRLPLIYIKARRLATRTLQLGQTRTGENTMRQIQHIVKPASIAGLAVSALLGFAGVTFSSAPAGAVVYCQYIDYPPSCVARAGVVLRPRPVARAAVRAGTASTTNLNGGVNRVGVRR